MESTTKQRIEAFLAGLSTEVDTSIIDVSALDLSDPSGAYDQIVEQLNDNRGFDIEIIYYTRAMEYLMERDSSLRESMRIASEMGLETKSLNSELLASLLASENAREDFEKLESEITDFFESLAEESEVE